MPIQAPTGSPPQPAARFASWPAVLVAYAVFGLLICCFRLDNGGLMLMEGMVADSGRAMLETGDWIVPTLYDEPYTYKPPLAYWLAAGAWAATDHRPTETELRLPFAVSAWLLGLPIVLMIGGLTRPGAGLMTGLAALGGGMYVQKVHEAGFDTLLSIGVGVAVAAACVNLVSDRDRWTIWVVGYLGLAVAFMTKGAIALMVFGPGLLAAAFAARRARRLVRAGHLVGLGLFSALCGGYLWSLWQRVGASGFEQPLAEAQLRTMDWTGDALLGSLAKPALIAVAFLPWSLLIPTGLARASRRAESDATSRLLRAGFGFLLAGALAFVFVPTHNMRYYLPLAVPIAIVAAASTPERREEGKLLLRSSLAVLAAPAIAALVLACAGPAFLGTVDRLLLAAATLAAAATAGLVLRRPTRRIAALLVATSLMFVVLEGLALRPRRAENRSLESVAATLAPVIPPNETLWVRGPADRAGKHGSLFFYLERRVRAFRTGSELPPLGAYYIYAAELQPVGSQPDLVLEPVITIEHPKYTYHLTRRVG